MRSPDGRHRNAPRLGWPDVDGPEPAGEDREATDALEERLLLKPAEAAAIAGRSIRTIRRAYRAGRLRAYRDGNGHGVFIAPEDLRAWMTASSAASPPAQEDGPDDPPRPLARLDMAAGTPRSGPSENLDLLNSARARLRRGAAPAAGAGPRAAVREDAPRE